MVYSGLFLYEAFICTWADKAKIKDTKLIYTKSGKVVFCYKKAVVIMLVLMPLILIMGFRYQIGADWLNYEYIFNSIKFMGDRGDIEWGYYLLNKFIGMFTDNSQIIFLIVSILINLLLLKALIYQGGNIYYGILAFMGLGYYFYAMNIQRQYIAIMIMFNGFRYLEQKDLKNFLPIVLIATMFHTSAIIWLAIYACVHIFKKGYYIIVLVFFIAITILRNTVLDILVSVNFYSARIQFVKDLIGEGKPSIVNIFISGVFMFSCFVLYKSLVRVRKENRIRIKLLWMLFLSNVFLWNFGGAASRIAAYLCPVYLLLLSDIVQCLPIKMRRILKLVLGAALFCFMEIIIHYSGNVNNHFLPYQYRI